MSLIEETGEEAHETGKSAHCSSGHHRHCFRIISVLRRNPGPDFRRLCVDAGKDTPAIPESHGCRCHDVSRRVAGEQSKYNGAQLRGGAKPDVVIMSREGLNELIKERRILPKSNKDLAETPLGVAVHAGSPKPDISTVETFKKALLEAKAFNTSSTSGLYLRDVAFPKLGIADQVSGKVIEGVITSEDGRRSEIAIQPASEISNVPGIDFVGVVPPEMQFNSIFSAAVVQGTAESDTARHFST
jgi:molybdate transport system substrate-binding protein